MKADFATQKAQWDNIVIDDFGYIPTAEVLAYDDGKFRQLIEHMTERRYRTDEWRNAGNKWREYLGLDSTRGKVILDYGCGVGLEALQFVYKGNKVIIADINTGSLLVASRTLKLFSGYIPDSYLIKENYPFITLDQPIDIFYCNGVLHHIPYARKVMERAHELLKPDGEARLLLYSKVAWEKYGQRNKAIFIRVMDQVGFHADWYDKRKLEKQFGDLFDVYFCEPITDDDRYLVAKLRRRTL